MAAPTNIHDTMEILKGLALAATATALATPLASISIIIFGVTCMWAVYSVTRKRAQYFGSDKPWCLITGAGSGIGRQMALDFCREGCNLVLWDVNRDAMLDTGNMIDTMVEKLAMTDPGSNRTTEREIMYQVVDVSDAISVKSAVASLHQRGFGPIDIIVSNAGVVSGKDADYLTDGDVRRTMGVNVNASFNLLRELLPGAKARQHGCFVFTSSVMGMVGSARLTDYCASKAAVIGLTDSLRLELARDGHSGISVITVCPYLVGTGMFNGVFSDARDRNWLRSLLFPALSAADVSAAVVRAVRAGHHATLVVPQLLGPFIRLARLLPLSWHDSFVGFMGGYHGMSSFMGHRPPQPQSAGTVGASAASASGGSVQARAARIQASILPPPPFDAAEQASQSAAAAALAIAELVQQAQAASAEVLFSETSWPGSEDEKGDEEGEGAAPASRGRAARGAETGRASAAAAVGRTRTRSKAIKVGRISAPATTLSPDTASGSRVTRTKTAGRR